MSGSWSRHDLFGLNDGRVKSQAQSKTPAIASLGLPEKPGDGGIQMVFITGRKMYPAKYR
jgi:hypothetical protein